MTEATNTLNLDFIMDCENVFDIFIPDEDAEQFGGLLGLENWLEQHLSNKLPTTEAAEALILLAFLQHRPELVRGLSRPWRREQISALVRDICREHASPMELHEMLSWAPLVRFGDGRWKSVVKPLLPTVPAVELFAVAWF